MEEYANQENKKEFQQQPSAEQPAVEDEPDGSKEATAANATVSIHSFP